MSTANDPPPPTPAAGADAELEAVLDMLFRGPRERFVAERNAAAQRLRTRGMAAAAARLKGLAKPSVTAWAVNQLWWTARAELEALLDASRDLVEALRTGAGPAAQTAAGQARRRALETLSITAGEVLGAAGHAAGLATLRRISTTLEALATHVALGTPEGRAGLGRLSEDLDPPGVELVMRLGAVSPGAVAEASPGSTTSPDAAPSPGRADAEAAVATAEREREAAREQVEEAARALDHATREADEVVLAAQHAVEEHRRLQVLADAARQRAEEAERVALRAQSDARREHERVEAAHEALTRRVAELERRSEALARARQRLGAKGDGRG